MKFKFLLLVILFAISWSVLGSDSVAVRKSLFIIPHPAYQQETSWSVGVAGGYYFKSKDISRISSISGSADYTLLNQFLFNITPKIFLNDNKWYFYSNLNFRNYPDFYYGIGNKPTGIEQTFTSDIFNVSLQPQYALTNNIYVGAILAGRYERVSTDMSFDVVRDRIFADYGREGWEEPFYSLNAGAMFTYDSRDNQFYPNKGFFAKTTFVSSKAGFASTHSIADVSVDMRNYISVYGQHLLAWQLYFEGAFSNAQIPFQLLPTLGGRDLMRGFRQGMYRDNVMMLFQTEYRIPVYKRIKAAVFMSAGDVMSSKTYQIDKLKVAYGAGLRCRLNDARVHLRLDLAKNNYGDKWQFYITATEAF